jgi:hypothetical protein
MSHVRELQQAFERELADWPGVSCSLERGAKHPRLILQFGGQTRFLAFPGTPSFRRGCGRDNMIAGLRQTLRGLGATRTPRCAPKRRLREFSCAVRP